MEFFKNRMFFFAKISNFKNKIKKTEKKMTNRRKQHINNQQKA